MGGEVSKSDKFEDVARDIECDESEDALDKALDSLNVKTDKEDAPKEDE
tara:strand:- start:376 stop:522 length:147 start_codon:yes stop_codon:yes gene_type:complete